MANKANELKEKYIQPVRVYWEGIEPPKRKKIGIGAGILLALIIVFVIWLNYKPYVVLFSNLDSTEASEILTSLQEKGVSAKVENNGTILVPEDQEAALKMQLATEGYPKDGFTYGIYMDNVDTMATNSDRRNYLIFQLQNRMQEAISTINGIKSAVVTITLPDDAGYVLTRDRQQASASVLVTLMGTEDLTKSQVNGIKRLVSGGVLGLDVENVSVINANTGEEMGGNIDSISSNAKDKLEIERRIDENIESKVRSLLESFIGPGYVHVIATSRINTDGGLVQSTTYIPVNEDTNTGVVGSESHLLEGTDNNILQYGIPGAETNADVTTYPQVNGEGAGNNFLNKYDYNYYVSERKEEIERKDIIIESIGVSVVITNPEILQQERARLTDLIAKAANVQPEDVVIYFANNQTSEPVSGATLIDTVTENKWILAAIAAVLLLIIIVIILIVRHRKKKKQEEFWAKQEEEALLAAAAREEAERIEVVEETPQQKLIQQVRDFADEHPEVAAQLIRTWLRGDE